MIALERLKPGAFAVALIWSFAFPALAQVPASLSALRSEALNLTNAARADAGLSKLETDSILNEVAQDHASDMLDRDFFDHISPEGDIPFDRFLAAGGSNWAVSGEISRSAKDATSHPTMRV